VSKYLADTKVCAAFVSTNSITQGELAKRRLMTATQKPWQRTSTLILPMAQDVFVESRSNAILV